MFPNQSFFFFERGTLLLCIAFQFECDWLYALRVVWFTIVRINNKETTINADFWKRKILLALCSRASRRSNLLYIFWIPVPFVSKIKLTSPYEATLTPMRWHGHHVCVKSASRTKWSLQNGSDISIPNSEQQKKKRYVIFVRLFI